MPTKEACYKLYFTGLYNHTFTDEQVAQNHTFSNKELFQLKSEHIFLYFANLAYGSPTPSVNDTPTKTKSATLE